MKFIKLTLVDALEKVVEAPKKIITKKPTDGAPKVQGKEGEKEKMDMKEEETKKRKRRD